MKHTLWSGGMLEVQKSLSATNVALPMHQRYCCMKKLCGSSGQMPIARFRGRYFICAHSKHSNGAALAQHFHFDAPRHARGNSPQHGMTRHATATHLVTYRGDLEARVHVFGVCDGSHAAERPQRRSPIHPAGSTAHRRVEPILVHLPPTTETLALPSNHNRPRPFFPGKAVSQPTQPNPTQGAPSATLSLF